MRKPRIIVIWTHDDSLFGDIAYQLESADAGIAGTVVEFRTALAAITAIATYQDSQSKYPPPLEN